LVSEQEIVVTDTPVTTSEDAPPGDEPQAPTGSTEQDPTEAVKIININDLTPGTRFAGKVKSVTKFGAFVDIDVGQDGLVHISELRRGRVEKVSDVVKEGDTVTVWIKEIDVERRRIGLTMIEPTRIDIKDLQSGMVIEGRVTRLEPYGAFVDIGTGRDGLVHVSEISEGYINSPADILDVGDEVQVRVLKVNRKKGRVDLSLKDTPAEQVVLEEQTEPTPTIMALAFQEALDNRQGNKGKSSKREGKRSRQTRDELDALIVRTLHSRQQ
jgi:small subunit ribosomal protein S1